MISALTANNELRRFSRSNMGKATLVSITLMPLLYSTLYLWSFWNPFGNLGELPVALVNNDQGTVVEGQQLNAGSQVTAGLLDDRTLNWQEVSEQEAIDGVRDGTYYFSVELPENFSEAVASPTSDNPEQATPIVNSRTGERGLVYGDRQSPQPGALEVRFTVANADFRVGDVLTTSGTGGVYPAGLPVGTVSLVSHSNNSSFTRVQAMPAAYPLSLGHVLVLDPQKIPQNEAVAAAAPAAAGSATTRNRNAKPRPGQSGGQP